jgi:hypothetical protein
MNAACINFIVDIAQVAAAFFAGIGLIITANQIRKSRLEGRLQRVSRVKEMLFHDTQIQSIYYEIEYEEFKYANNFHTSNKEKQLDKLLGILDILAKQVEQDVLEIDDLDLIMYEYLVVYQNTEVEKYLEFLDVWYKKRGNPHRPFNSFRIVGDKLERKQKR